MRVRPFGPSLLTAAALALVGCAGDSTVEGSSYSFEVPDGWSQGSDEEVETIAPLADTIAQGESVDGFATNINVIATGQVPADIDLEAEVLAGAEALADDPEVFGLPPGTVVETVSDFEETELGGETALEYAFETDTGDQVLLQRQITAISPDGLAFTVTASAVEDTTDRDAAFDQAVSSWEWE